MAQRVSSEEGPLRAERAASPSALGEAEVRALRLAKEAAEQRSEAKSVFLASVSHEVRTPLQAVIGMTGLLLDSARSAEDRERLEVVRSAGEAALSLINDILDFSRIDAGRLELEAVDFDLEAMVRETLQMFSEDACRRGLALSWQVAEGVPRAIIGDPARLRQVLANLVSNAMKFTDRGSVVVAVEATGGARERWLCVSVRDSGIGIAPEALGRIFEPFEQAAPEARRRHGGSGLGLAICHGLLAKMHGRIEVESRPGEGSCFRFSIPLHPGVAREIEPAADDRARADVVALPAMHVLVVDDVPVNQQVLRAQLAALGIHADVASDGAEALDAAARVPYDVILMDCRMPVMDGYEATRRLRALSDTRAAIPVVAMTAGAMPEDRENCRRAGMNAYLAKPVRSEALREMLLDIVVRRRTDPGPEPDRVAPEATVFDLEIWESLRSEIGAEFDELLPAFLDGMRQRTRAIHAAFGADDRAELELAAHSLKGSAASFGATRLAELSREIEELASDGLLSEVGGLLSRLDREVAQVEWAAARLQAPRSPERAAHGRPQAAAAANS